MDDAQKPTAVPAATTADGARIHLLDLQPDALPAVRARDLANAWDAAHAAALRSVAGARRAFRFRSGDGAVTDFAIADPDAGCWAVAVEQTIGLGTVYGTSVLLRLLALVDLLARVRWLDHLFTIRHGEAELHPALVRAAAAERLTRAGRFDEPQLRHSLAARPGRLEPPTGVTA